MSGSEGSGAPASAATPTGEGTSFPSPRRVSFLQKTHVTEGAPTSPFYFGLLGASEEEQRRVLRSATCVPEKYAALAQEALCRERAVTERLTEDLDRAWTAIEEVIARNADRAPLLAEETLAVVLRKMPRTRYWTGDAAMHLLNTQFHVSSDDDADDCEPRVGADHVPAVVEAAAVVAVAAVPEAVPAPEQAAEDQEDYVLPELIDSLPTMAKLSKSSWVNSFLPQVRPEWRPLRSLFAPLLQRRQELPRSLTLLLNEIQDLQKNHFPRCEQTLSDDDSSIVRAFERVATLINRRLALAPAGEAVEHATIEACRALEADLLAQRMAIAGAGTAAVSAPGAKPSALSDGDAAAVWATLADELHQRKEVHATIAAALADVVCRGDEELLGASRDLDECDRSTREMMREVAEFAKKVADGAEKMRRSLALAAATVDSSYAAERAALQERHVRHQQRLQRSAAAQERCARAIREAIKELAREQVTYETEMYMFLESRLRLAQLDQSYAQLARFIHATKGEVEQRAEPTREKLGSGMHENVEELRARLLRQCRLHVSRMRTEEHYRRVRLIDALTTNAMGWSRTVNDAVALLATRYDRVSKQTEISWQVNFLLQREQESSLANLRLSRAETAALDRSWDEVCRLRREYDLPLPAIDRLETEDPATVPLRERMLETDARATAQFRLRPLELLLAPTAAAAVREPPQQAALTEAVGLPADAAVATPPAADACTDAAA